MSGARSGDSEALARRLAAIAGSKKATDLVALDMRGLVAYTDFLVICTVGSERQAKAVHDAVHGEMKKAEERLPAAVEGEATARWVLMDYLDCVLHVFTPDARDRYRLETLWGEAPRLGLEPGSEESPAQAAGGG